MTRAEYLQEAYRLRDLIRKNPEQKTDLLLSMADAYLLASSFTNAIMVCKTILKLEPMNVRAMVRLGKANYGIENYDTSASLFETITALVPELEEGHSGLWKSLTALEQFKKAIKPAEQLLSLNPEDEKLLTDAALTCEKAGCIDKAVEHLRKLAEVASNKQPAVNLKLSGLLQKSGKLTAALLYLNRYLKFSPHDEKALMAGALISAKLKNWEQCAQYATGRIETGPFSPDGMYMLAVARINQAKFDEAILVLEQLVEKQPEPVKYRLLLAEAYFKAGELETAHTEFSRCLARQPERSDIIIRLAEIAWRRNRKEEAATLYGRTLRFNPAMALALFRLGYLKFDKGLYPAAISLLRRLLVVQPDNYKAHLILGQALRLTGTYEKAESHLHRSLELLPRQSKAEFELGLLYKTLKRYKQAEEHFNRAVKNDKNGPVSKDARYEIEHIHNHCDELSKLERLPLAATGTDNTRGDSEFVTVLKGKTQKKSKVRWIKL